MLCVSCVSCLDWVWTFGDLAPLAGSGARIVLRALVHEAGVFSFFFSESRRTWRGRGVRGRITRKPHMHLFPCCGTRCLLAGGSVCACRVCAVQRFERRLRAAWEAGVLCYGRCVSLVDRVTYMYICRWMRGMDRWCR